MLMAIVFSLSVFHVPGFQLLALILRGKLDSLKIGLPLSGRNGHVVGQFFDGLNDLRFVQIHGFFP
jgi:hypothetical protein